MSMISRYNFFKKVYPEYLFAFISGTEIKFVGVDKMILEQFCSYNNKLVWLQKKHINYIIIDDISIVYKYDDKNSQYEKYFYLCLLCNILGKYK